MTITEVNDVLGDFFVKLRGLKTENHYFYKQLPLNENENSFDEN